MGPLRAHHACSTTLIHQFTNSRAAAVTVRRVTLSKYRRRQAAKRWSAYSMIRENYVGCAIVFGERPAQEPMQSKAWFAGDTVVLFSRIQVARDDRSDVAAW
jgi:hypothetical protein